jgi:transcriptional regulator with XRE-family HTH domain
MITRVPPENTALISQIANAKELGALIRLARKQSGLTLLEAAASIGIAKQTLSDLERGRSSVGIQITLKVLRDLGLGILVAPKTAMEYIHGATDASMEQGQ